MLNVNRNADDGHVILAKKFGKDIQTTFFSKKSYFINKTRVIYINGKIKISRFKSQM